MKTKSDSMLGAALGYAERRLRVFPLHSPKDGACDCYAGGDCESPGKHPRTDHGAKDATSDPGKIRAWWAAVPESNIGISTDSLLVLDEDGEKGTASVVELEEKHGPLPKTLSAETGRGLHLYYSLPAGISVKNRAGILPGLDVRGNGGYVVAPPSLHASGIRYRWKDESEIAPAPEWLIQIATGKKNSALHLDLGIPEGRRNSELFSLACSLRAKGLGETAILAALTAHNAKVCTPPLPENEIATIVGSAARYDAPASNEHTSEMGNSVRFVEQHQDVLRYCYERNEWNYFDGRRWVRDAREEVMACAKKTVRALYAEAVSCTDSQERQIKAAWAIKSESEHKILGMIGLAKNELSIKAENFDTHPMLLNTLNGTLDLGTGILRPHRREDFLTQLCPLEYDQDAPRPRWEKFISEVSNGRDDLGRFIQKLSGYSLSGETREQIIPILHGAGGNGKNVYVDTFAAVLGQDYATEAAPDLLLSDRRDGHPTAIADLYGKRFVMCSETDDGKRLALGLVKRFTGNKFAKARRMREDYFQFTWVSKIFLSTNHRPEVDGSDQAIWDRIRLVPFDVRFRGTAREDKTLSETLRGEAPGILRWAVEGCLLWQREGLKVPAEVITATASYREEQNVLGTFLDDICVRREGDSVRAGRLYDAFTEWHRERVGGSAPKQKEFTAALVAAGIKRRKSNHMIYKGVALKSEVEDPLEK